MSDDVFSVSSLTDYRTRSVLALLLAFAVAPPVAPPEAYAYPVAALELAGIQAAQTEPWPRETDVPGRPKPKEPPKRWLGLIGKYGPEHEPLINLEREGHLWALFGRGEALRLDEISRDVFRFGEAAGSRANQQAFFKRDSRGRSTSVTTSNVAYDRRQVGPAEGSSQLHIDPVRPVAELLKEARTAQPPAESGDFRPSKLIEVVKLDPTIKLEIRYASTNNFLGSIFYSEPRAFLQQPAAEAVVRAHRKLKEYGYGLLIHDAYRPWYVTKAFWDATPQDKKWLVADPASGSRHNRGAAVDLTLYDLKTGRAVEMPSTYDESTPRAYAFYPGGADIQRWRRALLRRVMEEEGFTVNPLEWWHFDYKDWRSYRIGNASFSEIR